ncbi:MAG TPA: hypothetical protein VLH39_01550 [Magnetospirillaceae bacterium]|nr:hypothetical protein [Magnetospirillaceae bacterium]
MKVRVYAPPHADHSVLDDLCTLELPESARLRDVHRSLRIPLTAWPFLLCAVNYRLAWPGCRLKDGDTVSYFSMAGGG